METKGFDHGTNEKRAPLWIFEELRSLSDRLIQRAGWYTNPQGKLTLSMSANESVKSGLLEYLKRRLNYAPSALCWYHLS